MIPDNSNSEILTVSQLNQAVARLLERSFPLAWISGEISNFTRAASGHWYFTLKDANAQVRAVMFRGRSQATRSRCAPLSDCMRRAATSS